jgi:hypothetical protein
MTALLALIIFGGLAQETVAPPCDDECSAVLTAALQWTIEKAITWHSVDPARIRVDVSLIQGDQDRSEEQSVLGRIARDMSLLVEDMSRNPAFVACLLDRQTRTCRDAAGLAWISAHSVSFTGPGKATAYSAIRVLGGGGGEGQWDSLQHSELLLEMRDGTWEVVGVGITVAS